MKARLAVLAALFATTSVPMSALAANPSNKTVSLTCTSVAPDDISATATITLCDTVACAQAFVCPALTCDAASDPSESTDCDGGFKVGAVMWTESFNDTDGSAGSDQGTRRLAKGKAEFVQTQVSTFNVGDKAVLEVK